MTEAEWHSCTDPQTLVDFVRGQLHARKLRLLGVACCRCFWHLLSDDRSRGLVDCAERFADGRNELGEVEAGAHCRQELHAKGCHIVDWITGRE